MTSLARFAGFKRWGSQVEILDCPSLWRFLHCAPDHVKLSAFQDLAPEFHSSHRAPPSQGSLPCICNFIDTRWEPPADSIFLLEPRVPHSICLTVSVGVLAKFADLQGREEQEDAVRRGREKVKHWLMCVARHPGRASSPRRAGLATCLLPNPYTPPTPLPPHCSHHIVSPIPND